MIYGSNGLADDADAATEAVAISEKTAAGGRRRGSPVHRWAHRPCGGNAGGQSNAPSARRGPLRLNPSPSPSPSPSPKAKAKATLADRARARARVVTTADMRLTPPARPSGAAWPSFGTRSHHVPRGTRVISLYATCFCPIGERMLHCFTILSLTHYRVSWPTPIRSPRARGRTRAAGRKRCRGRKTTCRGSFSRQRAAARLIRAAQKPVLDEEHETAPHHHRAPR